MTSRLILGLVALLFAAPLSAEPSVRDYFEHSKFKQMQLSPDGEHVAFTFGEGSQWKLAVMRLEDSKITAGYEFGEDKRVQSFMWATDERLVMNVVEAVGYLDDNARYIGMYAANLDGTYREEILSGEISNSIFGIISRLEDDPEHILIQKRHFADEGAVTLNKLNIFNGELDYTPAGPAGKQKDLWGYGVDKDDEVRIAFEFVEGENIDDHSFIIHAKHNGEWKAIGLPTERPRPNMDVVGFSGDGDKAYLVSDHDVPPAEGVETNSQRGFFVYDFNKETVRKLFRHESVDVSGTISGPQDELLGLTTVGGYPEAIYLDGNNPHVKFLKGLQAAFPGQSARITSYSDDGKLAIARVYSDRNPGEFYLFNLESNEARFLGASMPQLKKEDLVPMEPVVIEARDGLKLHALLTLPEGEPKDLPLIVNVHGGPFGPFDRWGYNAEAQFFAAHGYATLQVNYRGSGNRGIDFQKLGWKEWGGKMQDDLTDATRWAIEKGIADEDRICIYGGSYGGYATLAGVVKEPDLYQCGVGYVGVYDLQWFAEGDASDMYRGDGERREGAHYFKETRVGKDPEFLRANSPVHNVEKIKADLFIVHGGSDVRVPIGHYDRLTEALDEIGKDYESMVKEEEGHGFQDVDNRVELYTEMLEFFDEHIGK
ncbi:MAG: S9 family peptidase [Gammaproteobacteria bacterium]|nr:S9 family peptidase [Gammaproteobacteria bacterium]